MGLFGLFSGKNKEEAEHIDNKSYFDEENDSFILRSLGWPEWPAESWVLTQGMDEITVLSIGLDEDEPVIQEDIPLDQITAVFLDDEDYKHTGFGELKLKRNAKEDLEISYDSGREIARGIAAYVAAWIAESAPEAASAPRLSAEELANELTILQNLLYSGILTQEEFDHKKRQLLGM